jgi:phosphogluconate dehydratase
MTTLHPVVEKVSEAIKSRSRESREQYLKQVKHQQTLRWGELGPTNLAHAFASATKDERLILKTSEAGQNIAIVTAYNDMVSAHQPYQNYPDQIKKALNEEGAVAQVAGGVPAMCDGITQGYEGMELSLFSRDVIAQSTAVALSHQLFDGVILLGTCDKIVPGLLMGALQFGHLPVIFIPSGPMETGQANEQKAYHSPGTCTFYGTANTNQLLLEVMGFQLPGSTFLNPSSELRPALNKMAAKQILRLTRQSDRYTPISQQINENSLVNAMVALLATGGSTNLTIHLIAIARCAGFEINWQDFSELSQVVPLLTKVYPNGEADINQFEAAGGVGQIIKQLLDGKLLHNNVNTLVGHGLDKMLQHPVKNNHGELDWQNTSSSPASNSIISSIDKPFSADGGLKLLTGNLGRGIVKVSAVAPEHRVINAPAIVFHDQNDVLTAFKAGELNRDFVAVVRFQGPRANGMPELHKLTPSLTSLQKKGFKVALLTDGRMSGASGKILAAIHVCPEAKDKGLIAKIETGDNIEIDANKGIMQVHHAQSLLEKRPTAEFSEKNQFSTGQQLFTNARNNTSSAETGALSLF